MRSPEQSRQKLGVEKLEDRLVPDGTSPIVYDVRNAFGNLQINDPWQVSVQDPSGNAVTQGGYNTSIDTNPNLNGYMTAPDPETVTMTPSYVIRATGNGYSIEYSDMPVGMKAQVSVFGMSQTDQNPSMIYHSQNIPQGSGTLQVALPWLNGSPRVYQIRLFDSINGIASARIIATSFYQNRIENPNYVRGMTMDDARYSISQPLSDVTTLMGVNVDANPHTAYSMTWNPNTAIVHPGPEKDAVLSWKSPGSGTVDLNATLKDAQLNLGDGVTVSLEKKSTTGTRVLASGMMAANGTLNLTRGTIMSQVSKDDLITLKVSATGSAGSALNSAGDATETAWTVSYTPGPEVPPEEILLRETAQDIADSLLATGQKIGDLRTAVADGNRTEQWELDAWHAYVERIRTNGPVSPLELQAAIDGESAQETEATLWSYVDESLAEAALSLSLNRDTVSLAGSVTGADTIRPAVSLALTNLGGSISLSSLQGSLPFAKVSLVSGADTNRALGTIETTGAAPVSIAAASGIANGQTSNDFKKVLSIAGLGNVTVETDTGVRDYSYSQVQDIYKLKVASNTLASTQNFHYWMQNINYGYVKVRLENGAYISAIDVTRLTPGGTGNLVVTCADGTTESFSVNGTGSIRIDKTVTGFTLYSQTGSYGLGNIDTRAVVPESGWEDMTEVRKLTGTAAMLDLTGADKLVTQVSGKVASQDPNDVITAHVYRGQQKVQSVVIGTDGLLSIQNDEGFSSIVLTHSVPASPLFLGGVSVETDGTAARTDWEPLSNATNAQLSELSAPRWVTDVSFNYIDTGRNHGVYYRYGGENVQINGAFKEGTRNPDPSKYHRLEARMMGSGSVSINRLLYIQAGGLFEVPPSYYTRLGSTVILHPGAPEFLAVEMQGSGRIDAPYFAANGATAEDVMPPSTPNFDANWLQWQVQPHESEGWTEVPSGVINRRVVAVPGSTLGTLWQIRNDGMQAGEVTVKVHVGQAGTSADPVQKIFTGVINPQQSRGLAFNVGILEGGDTVSLEIIRPDGTSFEYGRVTREARSNEIRRVNPVTGKLEWVGSYPLPNDYDLTQITRRYLQIAEQMGDSDMKAAAERLRIATTPEEKRVAYTALTNLPVTSVDQGLEQTRRGVENLFREVMAYNTAYSGVTLHGSAPESSLPKLNEALLWYQGTNVGGLDLQTTVRNDTIMGKIFLGLMHRLISATSEAQKESYANTLSAITNIASWKILNKWKFAGSSNTEKIAAMRKLFEDANYKNIFSFEEQSSMSAKTNKDTSKEIVFGEIAKYHNFTLDTITADEFITVRFDAPFTSYDRVSVYLADSQGNQLDARGRAMDANGNLLGTTQRGEHITLIPDTKGQMFILIPLSAVTNYISDEKGWKNPGRDPSGDAAGTKMGNTFKLKIVVWDLNNNAKGTFTDKFTVERKAGLPEIALSQKVSEDPVENEMLRRMHLPVQGSSWRYHMESGAHTGKDKYAIDLNKGALDHEMEIGAKVVATTAGKVVYVDKEEYGWIILQHITKINGIDETWFTGYMHLQSNSIGIKVNDEVNAGAELGLVGKTGVVDSSAHVHFSPYRGTLSNLKSFSSSLAQWMQAFQIPYGT